MNFSSLTDRQLEQLRDTLRKELQKLRGSVKNLNNTIKNITDDMRDYRLRHQILIENPQELPRA